jgi:predicted HAD superfamily Cof-like phosphohydrolase
MKDYTYFDQVGDFRHKMGLPMSYFPHLLSASEASYFVRFIMEELSEYMRACEEHNLVDATDAIVDLVYVALGCAHAMGLPFDEVFNAVHKANMQKKPADAEHRSTRGSRYDVVKPEGWTGPEKTIELILKRVQHENLGID